MSIAALRRVEVAGLLGLLAGTIVLMAAPGNPGAVRLSGVSLLWWYAAVVALLVDVAGLLGLPRWATSILVAAVALLVPVLLRGDREAESRAPLALAGGVAFVALVAVVGVALATSPWGAWKSVASQPAIIFGERDPWVTGGRTLVAPLALDFTELHRVTALSLAIYGVYEPGRFREWQLREGESLTLRAGDRLVLDAGARLRFEPGKRVPGAAASGVAWADPPERSATLAVADTIGVALTLGAGALDRLARARLRLLRSGDGRPGHGGPRAGVAGRDRAARAAHGDRARPARHPCRRVRHPDPRRADRVGHDRARRRGSRREPVAGRR